MLLDPGKVRRSGLANFNSQRARLHQQAMQGTSSLCRINSLIAVCIPLCMLCILDNMELERLT